MATNYDINYDDKRFTEVEADKKVALSEVEKTYGGMVNSADKYYDKQIQAAQDYADKQSQLQQEQTDFAIEQIEQQKAQAQKDYTKEQSGAYVDWQKQSNQYGANAEAMAAQGMTNTGYSESSQVSMYNTYQNRYAMARESYTRAVLNYDNAIKDARLQNNAALAEIAYNALQQQLELSLAGFQYKNQLILEKVQAKQDIDNTYYSRYQDVLKQINTENALAEEVRQYNEQMAEEKRQFNENLAYNKSKSNGSGGGGSSGGSIKGSSGGKKSSGSKDTSAHFSTTKDRQTNAKETVTNRHTDSWVEVSGHGRFSWTELKDLVDDGQVKESKSNGKITYTWVKKSSGNGKNVTPDKKGYAAKQYDLMYGGVR